MRSLTNSPTTPSRLIPVAAAASSRRRQRGTAARLAMTLASLLIIAAFSSCDPPPKREPLPPAGRDKVLTEQNVEFPRQKVDTAAIETVAAKPETESDRQMTGRLIWDESATSYVFSPVSGRVDKIIGRIGQTVAAGDDLAWLRSPDYAQALAAAKTAAADQVQAKESLDRQNLLRTKGAAALQDQEAAQASYDQALAEKQRADLWLKQLGVTSGEFSDLYHVRSPIAGVIVGMNIHPGQEVRSDIQLAGVAELVKPLYTISDPAHLWVQVDVREGQLNLLKPGDTVHFRTPAYPDKVFTGKLAVVGTSLDPQTRVASARAVVDNSEGLLRAEMYVTVQLPRPTNEPVAVEIPASAVFFQDGKYFAIAESAPHKFELHEVRIVHEGSAGVSVVVRGISPGQNVISDVDRNRPLLVEAGEITTPGAE